MTTSRVIRGTRAKVFLYLCGILIIVGIIACYNNTLSHLDDVKKSNFICHQQEENLSTQLQVISDYKQRLEKTLKTEQADHVQTKANLENQLKEERSKYENEATDMKHKLESVQQHLNLLQTQYTELQSEKEKLAKELENQNKNSNDQELSKLNKENKELKDEVEHLKAKCNNQETLVEPNVQQVEDTNKNLETHDSNKDEKIAHQEPDTGAGNAPLFVLAQPYANDNKVVSSSTSSNNVLKPSQASLDGARPILVPTLTPVSVRKDNKVPEGVVAIPEKKEDEVVNARYQNARESANELVPQAEKAAKDEIEKENVAHEVFDAPLFHDGLQFDNDNFKQVDKPNFDKRHIDTLGAPKDKKNQEDQGDYKDQNDVQLEENDDDDGDGYDDHLARQKEPAVRN
ncbi:interaptin isoform X2 [Diabrotica virgifera virgifera]|uniref:Interaptin-like isoform X2 n=1 Tax=Diabrotica virgifera virgifera TaxID=50390 RepID=A0A6P7EZW3_DIAVI|nr:interaptin isoform X2 [Diabrotica virgifera virgifera]